MARLLPLAALAVLALAAPASAAEERKVLRVTAIPDENPNELLRKFEPLGAYLSQKTGLEVKFVPVTDYAAVVEALAGGHVDLAWLGGFTFVQARIRTKTAVPIVQRAEDAQFHSKFITAAGSGITSLAQLKGKTFAFGSASSTSGHLMPRHFLGVAGIVPERDFASFAYSGAHDATVKLVETGKAQAGALNESVWQKLVDQGKVDPAKVTVFHTTPGYYDYNWTVRGDLDPAVVAKVKAAFLALDPANPEHKRILDLQRASRFVETRVENYAGIETAARSAGLIED